MSIEGGSASEAQVKALMQTLIGEIIETKPLILQALQAYATAASPDPAIHVAFRMVGGFTEPQKVSCYKTSIASPKL